MSIRIDQEKCAACGRCREICPGNLIKRAENGKVFLKRPEECWGCASCLKECVHGAIAYFLGADIGGRGSLMRTKREGDVTDWIITLPEGKTVTISVNRRNANEY
ncbi:MAG: ferredoxin family protein [bacterium]|nr:ferredoxin family protein [bacterium]